VTWYLGPPPGYLDVQRVKGEVQQALHKWGKVVNLSFKEVRGAANLLTWWLRLQQWCVCEMQWHGQECECHSVGDVAIQVSPSHVLCIHLFSAIGQVPCAASFLFTFSGASA
jgi:hypothetical protein